MKLKTATGLQFWRTAMILSILIELGKLLEIISTFLLKKICGRNWNIRNQGLMKRVQNFSIKVKQLHCSGYRIQDGIYDVKVVYV